MASALLVSFLFAALGVPLLARWLLREQVAATEDIPRWLERVQAAHAWLLERLLRRPAFVLAGVVPLLLVSYVAYRHIGSGFLPAMDEGGFVLDYRAPSSTSLSETDRRLRELEKILAQTPEVLSYSRRTGLVLSGSVTEANEGDYFVRLKPLPRRPLAAVMDEVRERAATQVPGLELEFAQLMEDLIGDLTAVPQPIEVKLFGSDPASLRTQAGEVADRIGKVPGVVDVKSGIVLAGDAVSISVDRLKAKLLGIDPDQVTRLAKIALEGVVTSEVKRGEKMVGIRVWSDPEARARIELIRRMSLVSQDGTRVRLGRVAALEFDAGQPQITRENLKTLVAVTGRISGRDLGSVMQDVKKAVGSSPLLPGIYAEYGGLYRLQQDSFQGLILVLLAALMLVFGLLLYLYEWFAAPFAILAVALLAAAAVFPALWLTGIELNITSLVGLTMIVGISSEASIFYMSQFRDSSLCDGPAAALIAAGTLRFRPIAMTALAAILALLPLALGIGQGSAMLQPLAIAIIAGLLLTVPAVLLLLPVFLRVLSPSRFRPAR
jgi:multidrug efflux pump subunit AcrB